MKISDVRIRLVNKDDDNLKAFASITIDDCFAVHDIKVIDAGKGAFIAMPGRKTSDGDYKDIAHPLNSATRELLKKEILSAFDAAKQKTSEQTSTDGNDND
jgi:stage V sporulation protein G